MKLYVEIVMFCGCTVSAIGGLLLTFIIIAFLWDKALTMSLQAFGESTRTWLDILWEMHSTGRLRYQKKKGTPK